jgi:hypothetical protein
MLSKDGSVVYAAGQKGLVTVLEAASLQVGGLVPGGRLALVATRLLPLVLLWCLACCCCA